jgi:hypothetical protein
VSRRRRARLPPSPQFDFDGTLYVLRNNLGRADAMIVAADELIVQFWSDDEEEEILLRRIRISYCLEAAGLAVRAASHAGLELHLHRRDA